MKLYVGTYKKYNEGNLFGEWVDLDDFYSKEHFLEYCHELHKDEDDPEFMFQDYEDDIEGEYDNFASESSISEEYWEFKEYCNKSSLPPEAILEYGSSYGDWRDAEENSCGSYEDFQDWYLMLGYEIPDHLANYIDWDALESDILMYYSHFEINGITYLFN